MCGFCCFSLCVVVLFGLLFSFRVDGCGLAYCVMVCGCCFVADRFVDCLLEVGCLLSVTWWVACADLVVCWVVLTFVLVGFSVVWLAGVCGLLWYVVW